ncbi:MAG TPA: AI-2E family transporter [Pontiellaceae bacterium]|nr:AI-2E family transporter [Pontiellaceae bacterium]HPR83553.1 AI-2E family transporter [Pontiellaceae bacterium]
MQNQRVLTFLTGVIALVLVGFVLKIAQAVVLPLVIAWFLSYILAPPVNFLARHRVPTAPAVAVVMILLFGFFYLTGLFLYSRSMAFIEQYPKYADQFTQIATAVKERYTVPAWLSLGEIDWNRQIGQHLMSFSGSFIAFTGNLAMVLVFLIFMLLGKPYFAGKVRRAFPDNQGQRVANVTSSIAHQISRYLYVKLILSTVSSLLVWIVLVIGKSDFPLTWAVLAFLLSFIPSIGTVLASVPPVLLAFVQFYPNFWVAAGIATALLIIHQVIGCLVEPKVMGDKLNLSPMVILLSLVFWGWLWGITGALLAVPIAAAIKIVCENIEMLKPAAVLMGADTHHSEPL